MSMLSRTGELRRAEVRRMADGLAHALAVFVEGVDEFGADPNLAGPVKSKVQDLRKKLEEVEKAMDTVRASTTGDPSQTNGHAREQEWAMLPMENATEAVVLADSDDDKDEAA